jgi:regulator of protease activity HflC (stomatin/prohibitin superfamily)
MMYQTHEEMVQARKAAQEKRIKRFIGLGVIGFAVLIGLIVLLNSNTRVNPGYNGVQYSLVSGLKAEELKEGLKWHAPWVNVYEYPVSTETVVLKKGKDKDNNKALQINTGDGKSVEVDITYAYYMEPEKLDHIFKKFRRQPAETIADTYIKNEILNTIQNVTTKHSVLQVYSQKRESIVAEIRAELTKSLAKDGIVLEKFVFSDVRPDAKTVEILQQIANAETQKEAIIRERANLQEQNKNIAQQKANDLLAAQEDKKIAEVNAEKKAQTILIEAQGQAKANKELEKSLTPTLVQYEWIKAWQAGGSQVPKISGDSNSFIQVPENFFDGEEAKK